MDTYVLALLNGLTYKSTVLDGLLVFLAQYLPFILPVIFIGYAFLRIREWRKRLTAIGLAFSASFLARIADEPIRFFYHRPRPFVELHLPHLLTEDSWSFPSGHASFFFALSAIVYGYDKRLGIAFFIASALIGLARVAAGVHYPSDILGGAVLGILVGYGAWRLAQKLRLL